MKAYLKKIGTGIFAWCLAGSPGFGAPSPKPPKAVFTNKVMANEVIESDSFGQVYLYEPKGAPQAVILFVSGDGGWNKGVIDMAQTLVDKEHALVVGIDIRSYLNKLGSPGKKCRYAAADFEALSKFVQKRRKLSNYLPPFIYGYSSGATLAYVVYAEAPINTFMGALSLGFCSDLDLPREICAKNNLAFTLGATALNPPPKKHNKLTNYVFSPAGEGNNLNWVVLHGNKDEVCKLSSVREFVEKTSGATLIELNKVGHGFSVAKNWKNQYHEATAKLLTSGKLNISPHVPSSVEDVPILEKLPEQQKSDYFVVFFSGDGGWADLDDGVADKLVESGVPVIGWNSLQYFWTEKKADDLGRDLTKVILYYQQKLALRRVTLVGFSFGADVAPFFAANIDEKLRHSLKSIVLLGPSKTASFEFHLDDWIGSDDEGFSVQEEIAKLRSIKMLCVQGKEEHDSICQASGMSHITATQVEGGHHFGGHYDELAGLIQQYSR